MSALALPVPQRILNRLPVGLRHAAIYAAALVLTKVTALLMLPIFTHFLTPEEYGRLDILQTLANLLSIIVGFGLADTLFRFAGACQDGTERKEAAAQVLGLALLIGAVSFIATQAAAPWIAALLPGDVGLLSTRLILASLSLTGAILVPLGWMRMSGRPMAYFTGSAGRAVAQAILIALFLSWGFGIEGVLLAGMICAITLASLLTYWQWRETGIRFAPSALRAHGRFGGMLVVAGMATFILDSCDRWILAGTIGPAALADYALAGKVGIMAAFLTQPFEMWWLPKRFAVLREETGPQRCARAGELGLCIAMIASLGIAGTGAFMVEWLTPIAYHGAIAFIPALAGLAALNAGTTLINIGVLAETKGSKPIWIDGSAAILAGAAYLVLIPSFEAWGAVWATVLALSYRFAVYALAGQRATPLPYRFTRLSIPTVITVAGLVSCSLATNWIETFLTASAFAAIAACTMVLLGLVPKGKSLT